MVRQNVTLRCEDQHSVPVRASVSFEFESGRIVPLETDNGGQVILPVAWGQDRISAALIRPYDRHWARYVPLEAALTQTGHEGVIVCELSKLNPHDASWWRKPFASVICEDCRNIRIGIIDAGFRWGSEFENFRFLNTDGDDLDRNSLPLISHGGLVAGMFIGWPDVSAFSRAEFFFVDASDPDGDDEKLDLTAITAAFELLSEDLKVDIINISGGFYADAFAGTEHDDAASAFCENIEALIECFSGLVVASAGNDRSLPVCMPANLPGAVGVSGVAQVGIAPAGSRLRSIEQFASRIPGAVPTPVGLDSFYHVWSLASGEEVDTAAPGSGIWLSMPDGALREFEGTSFSAPIVTAALACALSRRRKLDASYRLSKDILGDLCVGLGLSPERQGHGMPVKP